MAASVILAKCSVHNKVFGIRVEKRENDWVRTWAFPIDEARAKREGFDKTKIKGSLTAVDGYPGCPYCGTDEFVQCPCDKISCWHESKTEGKSEKRQERKTDTKSHEKIAGGFRCPWCGRVAKEIENVEAFTVKSEKF